MERFQCTVKRPIKFSGIGLHSGKSVNMEIVPAPAGAGIVFHRCDVLNAIPVLAHPFNICTSALSTTLGSGPNSVATIEHLMASFAGMGIDNALVRLDGPEVPILDGSAQPFVEQIEKAGIYRLEERKKLIYIKEFFEVRQGDRYIRVEPSRRRRFRCKIEFKSRAIGSRAVDFEFNRNSFRKLCRARTFCHIDDVVQMQKVGLALGGSLKNAVVVDDDEVINKEGLRSKNEFAEHKLLDCIGDFATLGGVLIGDVELFKAGHSLHAEFISQLMRNKDELLTIVEPVYRRDHAIPAVASAYAAVT